MVKNICQWIGGAKKLQFLFELDKTLWVAKNEHDDKELRIQEV